MRVIVITPAEAVENETVVCNLLFASGLEVLHLRKPGAGREAYERFVRAIEPRYRERIVVHEQLWCTSITTWRRSTGCAAYT